jgi:hypothetical protein
MLAPEQGRPALAHRAGSFQLRQVFAAPQVFADRDEFHLGRDDAAFCVVHLRDVGAGFGAARRALQLEAQRGAVAGRSGARPE